MSSLAVLLFAVVVILCTGSGSAATIEIRPNKYDGVVPTSFNITCTPHVSAANACPKKILAIQVSRNGSRPFVTLQPQSEISYNRLLRSNIEAEGRIGKTVGESRLTVTFSNVMKEDSGLYSCDVIYLDEWGSIQRETATHNFTVEGPDTHDVIKYLMGKLVSMETIIQNQQTQLETTLQNQQTQLEMKFQNQQTQMETTFQNQQTQLETTLQNQQTQLETTIQNQQTQMEKQENRMSELDDKTTRYIEKESRKSAFLVGYENKGALSYGQIVKFTNVRENIGGDFNVTSGVYTAPVDGLYAFHLYGMVYKSGHKEFQIAILANSQKVAALLAEDGDNYDQSSVSAVVNLKAGDIVKCSVTYLRSTANQLHSFPYSGFTGHLITAL